MPSKGICFMDNFQTWVNIFLPYCLWNDFPFFRGDTLQFARCFKKRACETCFASLVYIFWKIPYFHAWYYLIFGLLIQDGIYYEKGFTIGITSPSPHPKKNISKYVKKCFPKFYLYTKMEPQN